MNRKNKNFNDLDEVFTAFEQLKVLIIGDVMVDAYIYGNVSRISPEAPVPVINASERDYRLGGAANVARNITALGAEPILCSVIGADDNADILLSILHERNISTEGIVKSTERPTTVKTRVISGSQQMLRIDDETTRQLSDYEEKQLLKAVDALLPEVDIVIFEDYDKGVLGSRIIERIIKKANEKGIPTTVDPKKRNFLDYNHCTLFKPNLKELKEGLKVEFDHKNEEALEKAVEQLDEVLTPEHILITLSENGVLLKSDQSIIKARAHRRSIADVSGAGDTVISIASVALALGLSPQLIMELSNLGGGLVCEHLGVVPISKVDLLREARKHNLDQLL